MRDIDTIIAEHGIPTDPFPRIEDVVSAMYDTELAALFDQHEQLGELGYLEPDAELRVLASRCLVGASHGLALTGAAFSVAREAARRHFHATC